jgi:hypothetical protein
MMVEGSGYVSDFTLNHLKREDMRPKEDFKKLDLVRVTGGHITGRIMAFDADHRLAHVNSTIGLGWWYLKDLELENSGSRKDRKDNAKGARETFVHDGLRYLKGTAVNYEGQSFIFQPALDTRLPEYVS